MKKTSTPARISTIFFFIMFCGLIMTIVFINDPVPVKQMTTVSFLLVGIAYLLYELIHVSYSGKNTKREQYIQEAILAARDVQDFLWGEGTLKGIKNSDPQRLKSVCIDMYQKRIEKLKEIDFTNKSASVELRKRILQNAAISIKMLEQLN